MNNPARTLTVLEPGGRGGCENRTRSTVRDTARTQQCVLATNAGFYNTTTDECLGEFTIKAAKNKISVPVNIFSGNLVTNGIEIMNNGGIQNAHFGIKKDGSLFTGYKTKHFM